jgi:tripartite-type tricarboxylate transporter receptor subunit TctC
MQRRHLFGATAGLLAAPAITSAQGAGPWPSRQPIRLVATFPPGGLVDTMTRLVAPVLAQSLGQSVVVENRVGAGGVVGTDHVARQPADGYSFVVTHAAVFVFATATMPSVAFDPIADFTHLGMLVEAATVLMVRADSPIRTLGDYVAAARQRQMNMAIGAVASGQHILAIRLKNEANLPLLEDVLYQGSAPALRDFMGGQVESMIDAVTTNVQHIREGRLRAIAISTPRRLDVLPEVPTFAEQGFPTFLQTQWLGLSGPRGLPEPIAQRMMQEIPRLIAAPAVIERAQALATLPRNPTPMGAAFVEVIRTELAAARDVATRYNIRAQV